MYVIHLNPLVPDCYNAHVLYFLCNHIRCSHCGSHCGSHHSDFHLLTHGLHLIIMASKTLVMGWLLAHLHTTFLYLAAMELVNLKVSDRDWTMGGRLCLRLVCALMESESSSHPCIPVRMEYLGEENGNNDL